MTVFPFNSKIINILSKIAKKCIFYELHKMFQGFYNDIERVESFDERRNMEIIKINSDSFKVSLDAQETEKYHIKTIDEYTKEDASASIRALLEILKDDGVDFGKERVFAEVYLSKDGSCEIFISKALNSLKKLKSTVKPLSKAIYRFSCLKDLLNVCMVLKNVDYNGDCEIYYNEKQKSYYALLYGIYQRDIKYAFLSEFGEKIKESIFPYIKEYCLCLCDNNAVEIFSKLL